MSLRRDLYAPIGVFLVHSVIAYTHGGPVAVPDVTAYLRFAQWPYGGITEFGSAYFPLYGVLLSAFGSLSGSDLHTAALLVNGGVAALLLWVTVRLATELGLSRCLVIAIGIFTALMPTMAGASRMAWPEALLALLITCTYRYLHRSQPTDLIKAGVCVGVAAGLHPRAAVLVIALIVVALFGRCVKQILKGLVPALSLVALLVFFSSAWPSQRLQAAGETKTDSDWLVSAGGQLLAMAGATCAIGLIGLVGALMMFRKLITKSVNNIAAPFLGLSALLMMLLGGWVLTNGNKSDTLLYGRYLAPWYLGLTILGLLLLSERKARVGTVLISSISILVTMFAVISAASSDDEPSRVIMTLSLTTVWKIFDQSLVPTVVTISIISLCSVLIFRSPKRYRYWAPLVLCICMAFSSSLINNNHLAEVGRIADGQSSVALGLPQSTACVNIDVASTKPYAKALYGLYLPKTEIRPLDLMGGKPKCGKYIIAGPAFLEKCDSAILLSMEKRGNWGLWEFKNSDCF